MLSIYNLVCKSYIVWVVIGFVILYVEGARSTREGHQTLLFCARSLQRSTNNLNRILPSGLCSSISHKTIPQWVKGQEVHVLSGEQFGLNECVPTKSS